MKVVIRQGNIPIHVLAAWAGGELICHPQAQQQEDALPYVASVCTDSREVTATATATASNGQGTPESAHGGPSAEGETLFCAIRGERVDGHAYMARILEHAHIGCFLCETIPEVLWNAATPWVAIQVSDTVEALAYIAAAYRRTYLPHLKVVGVTGSVGKTTVKECCAAVLSTHMPTFRREGNFNSVIGLPLSVLEIDAAYQAAVLEMGMSALGEIRTMSKAVCPDIGLITNIGSSHLEHLGTRENIARAKWEIQEGIPSGGHLLLPGDELLLEPLRTSAEGAHVCQHRMFFEETAEGADAGVSDASAPGAALPTRAGGTDLIRCVHAEDNGMTFDLCLPEVTWSGLHVPALGRHMVWAAAYSALVGYLFGMTQSEVQQGLNEYRPAALRQNWRVVRGVWLLEDCYNAAPESMAAALDVLTMPSQMRTGRHFAVLGDMKELGPEGVALHRRVGALCAAKHLDGLVTVGALGAEIARGAREAGMPSDSMCAMAQDGAEIAPADVVTQLAAWAREGDSVLLKASRAMGFERISQAWADMDGRTDR